MAPPQVAAGGTASNVERSCEYIELAVADSRQEVVLQLGGWARCWQLLSVKTYPVAKQSKSKPRTWTDTFVRPMMDLQEMGCGGMDSIQLAQERDRWRALVNAVMNLLVPQNVGNLLTSWKPVSFSRRTVLHGVSK